MQFIVLCCEAYWSVRVVMTSPFLKKSIQQNEKQVADNNRKMAVSCGFIYCKIVEGDGRVLIAFVCCGA